MTQNPDINIVALQNPTRCAQSLKNLAEKKPSPFVNTRIKLKRFKNGTYHFRITRSLYHLPTHRRYRNYGATQIARSNYVKVHVTGYLVQWADSETTIVIGEAAVDPKTFIINAVFLFAFALPLLGLTIALLGEFLICAPIVMLTLASFTHMTVFQPENLAEKQKDRLVKQIVRSLQVETQG